MIHQLCMLALFVIMFFIVYKTMNFPHEETELEARPHSFDSVMDADTTPIRMGYLPHGIMHSSSDMELKPLSSTKSSIPEKNNQNSRNLLVMAVCIKQKKKVNAIVKKFIPENFTVMLFHYDGNVDGWHNLRWSNNAIHVVAYNQTKWWFAKRFLHPDVVSSYDYIFIWDEDLGVEDFHPGRYVKTMKTEHLEIIQLALDPKLSDTHHSRTATNKDIAHYLHIIRRVNNAWDIGKCAGDSKGHPCSRWVEGKPPVFSTSAWRCAWPLIQNDPIHGWGMNSKIRYCAQKTSNGHFQTSKKLHVKDVLQVLQ